MSKQFFLEHEKQGEHVNLSLVQFLAEINFNADGLIPAIAQQYDNKEVLMMAWMNKESIEKTLTSKRVCYWSRSRQKFWYKGEESGHIQHFKKMALDCDGDAILLSVDQIDGACHTGRKNCFYWEINNQTVNKRDD